MKKNLILILTAVVLIACGNSKSIDKSATESETNAGAELSTPQVVPDEPKQDAASGAKAATNDLKPASIEWLDFETAIERNKKEPKYIFIDLYTDWCGWCKKMDASTFVNADVAAYITEHFYAVKMDAEMKEAIAYNGQLFEYKQFNARSGYNTLAVSLLDSKMSFPSFVILDKKEVKKGKMMGYKTPVPFLTELKTYVK